MIKKFIIFLAIILNINSASALENSDYSLDDLVVIGEYKLKIYGFKIYNIKLLGEDKNFSYNQKLALNIHYNRDFSKEDLVKTSLDEILRINQISKNDSELYKSRLEEIFVSVKKGDEKTAIFDPNFGLILYHNQKLNGKIADKIFAQRFFDIWLSENAKFLKMRNKLISK